MQKKQRSKTEMKYSINSQAFGLSSDIIKTKGDFILCVFLSSHLGNSGTYT